MKRVLVLLAASLFYDVSADAQTWEIPQMEYSELEVGKDFYLFNKTIGKFYTEGNLWGTQGSVGEKGLLCRLLEYSLSGDTIVRISNYSEVKKQWMSPYITTNGSIYVDGIDQKDSYWKFESKGNGVYKIKMSSPNPTYNQENYPDAMLGLDLFEDSTRTALNCLLMESEEPGNGIYHTDWCLVTPDDYELYQLNVERYDKAMNLEELIKEATLKGKDVTEESAVYNNTSSTLDELNKAIDSVTRKILEDYIEGATPENPVDVTGLFVVNPDYSNNDNDGWSGNVPGFNALANVQNAEFFYTNFDYYQDLRNLPDGYYQLSVQGFYRAGLHDEALSHKQGVESDFMYAELYAVSGQETKSVKIHSIFDGATNQSLGVEGEIKIGEYYVPDGMTSAAEYFSAGRYSGNKVIVHVTDGSLRIGMRKGVTLKRDWVMFDNWSLLYLGNETPVVNEIIY